MTLFLTLVAVIGYLVALVLLVMTLEALLDSAESFWLALPLGIAMFIALFLSSLLLTNLYDLEGV